MTEPVTRSENTVEHPAAPDPNAPIQADEQPNVPTELDSALGDDLSAASTSLASSMRNYQYKHGRRYHAFREGAYLLPNDEAEQDRLDLHHHVFRLTVGGALFRAPISANPQKVLDIGTGTGLWAVEFADEFPSAQVVGTDLSPIQPGWVPPNLKFYVEDAESDWVDSTTSWSGQTGGGGTYDFVHSRAMSGSITDWAKLCRQAWQSLKPGGWLELQEYETHFGSDDDPDLANAPYLKQWQDEVNAASETFGKVIDVANAHKQRLIDAGFVDVADDVYKVPIGPWPRDADLKRTGLFQLVQVCQAIEPFALGYLISHGNWQEADCRTLVERANAELRNPKNHFYVKFHYVYGRRP